MAIGAFMRFLILALLFLATPALAQQSNDPLFLNRAISALQQQRNQAWDAAAVAEARAAGLADDLAKANARIKDLEPKPSVPDKPQ
jgi:hypothetical protein